MTAADLSPVDGAASDEPERQSGIRQWMLELIVGLVALTTAVASYLVLAGAAPVDPNEGNVSILLIANILMALVLVGAIVWRLYNLSRVRGSGVAGAQLHVRMVMIFAAIAIVPTVLVALFSAVILNLGINSWFSDRVRTSLENASSVAEAYVSEHKQSIQSDALAVAAAVNRQYVMQVSDPSAFQQYLYQLVQARSLSIAAIFDGSGRLVTAVKRTIAVHIDPPELADFKRAGAGDVVILADSYDDRVQALVRLDNYIDRYLLVIRYVDTKVLANQREAVAAAREYEVLEKNRTSVQLAFAATYAVVGLLMLLAAVSLGLNAANRIVQPIGRLIGASERVSAGDLTARVRTQGVDGELANLSNAFNKMTAELQSQQEELVETNRIAEDRRLFAEAVLSGVSAGVIGLDALGRIDAANPTAAAFLGYMSAELTGRPIEEIAPEIAGVLAEARLNADGRASGQLDIARGGRTRNLSVRVTSERTDGHRTGFVITFDDMTDLVAAQRSAAWGDVARRIAHEIKNPLTPIQLSAERLRRKYGKEITSDPSVFEQCTQTIIRQVGDIGRMVDEFSSFARMPVPIAREEDAGELVRQAVFLQSVGNPSIEYMVHVPESAVTLICDGRLVAQALTNVLKNAAEAVTAKFDPEAAEKGMTSKPVGGRIDIALKEESGGVVVSVSDNGVGLPNAERERLTEPYVTTRGKGTGLGLAIVKKIMEEHGGTVGLSDSEILGGAQVTLRFPVTPSVLTQQRGLHEQDG